MVNSATLTSIILHTSCNLNEVNSKWFNDIVRAKTEPVRLQKSLEFGLTFFMLHIPYQLTGIIFWRQLTTICRRYTTLHCLNSVVGSLEPSLYL